MKRPLNEIETFRAQELLLQRATEGLSDQEAAELVALGAEDDISFDLAASAVDIATIRGEEMPFDVADKILIAAGVEVEAPKTIAMPAMVPQTLAGFVPPRPIGVAPVPVPMPAPVLQEPTAPPAVIPIESRRTSRATTYAVIAAAASIALAIGAVVWATRQQAGEPTVAKTPTAEEARAELLATAKDATTLPWTATDDPNAKGATGDIVWSPSAQRGYMRFKGLTPNDIKTLQYQLWIFDKDRDQAFPVDGGVFDVSSTGEVIVEITAKLRVNEPVLFAVTIEKPGGVVVSKRERIVVTAAPKA